MKEIDFTNCKPYPKVYGGANGSKRAIEYKNELYMLKFPPNQRQITIFLILIAVLANT